ncbi:MAG: insulinase family protein [Tepidisphaera sp.]
MASIETVVLSCGMTLVIEPIAGVRSAALSWLVPGGAAEDPADRLGRAAVWQEMLMRGAGSLDSRSQADVFDRLGCSRSVSVGGMTMRIGATMLGDRLKESLPLLVDMVRAPKLDEDSVEPSKDLALQAIESLKDEPQERAMVALGARHHRAPLNRSGLGTAEGIQALTHHELAHGWKAAANPGRSIMAVAGSVDPVALRRQLEQLLGGWSGGHPEPALGGEAPRGYAHETDESNQVQIVVAHDGPKESEPDAVLEKVVASVLSGGMSGRLFSEVREKRALCYSVSAGYRGERDFGTVTAYVGTTPERAQESLDVLFGELERIGTPAGRVTSEELGRAVVGMKSRLVFSGESTGARAGALVSDQYRLGRARSLRELADAVDKVTVDQVNAYLARRKLGRVTVQTLGPASLKAPAAVG